MAYRKAWEVAYRRDRAAGKARYVEAEPTRARLAELAAAKVPLRTVARACGLSDTGIKAILAGTREHVQRSSAERVEQLSLHRIYAEQTTGQVPRAGAVRRVQALMAMGWSHRDLAAAGVPNTPNLFTDGHLVTVQRWREIRDVYDRLSMTPGPSPETRGRAKSRHYAPPLAWDDTSIDDPTATPRGEASKGVGAQVIDMVAVRRTIDRPDAGPALNTGERQEVVRAMAATGASDREIGNRLGVVDRTVLRWRQRREIPAGHPRTTGAEHDLESALARAATRTASPGPHREHPHSAEVPIARTVGR